MAPIRLFPYTDQLDGLAHLVTDDAVAAGIASRKGIYQACCGYVVTVTSLTAPDGATCARCLACTRVARTPGRPPALRLRALIARLLSGCSAGPTVRCSS